MKTNLAQKYLDEPINFGGFRRTRGEVILEMQAEGHPQRAIDLYLMGAKTISEAEADNLLTGPYPVEVGDAPLPEPVEAKPLPELNHYQQEALSFLSHNQIGFEAVLSNTKPAKWQPSGHHYIVTLRDLKPGRNHQLTFDFWDSHYNKQQGITTLAAYDVLAAIATDHIYQTAKDVYAEFGRDTDLDVPGTLKFAKEMREFFTEEELEALERIQ
jgi:hypothetical protein